MIYLPSIISRFTTLYCGRDDFNSTIDFLGSCHFAGGKSDRSHGVFHTNERWKGFQNIVRGMGAWPLLPQDQSGSKRYNQDIWVA